MSKAKVKALPSDKGTSDRPNTRSQRCPKCKYGFADQVAQEMHECIEKCPVPSCRYHTQGLIAPECARHVLEHYDVPIMCEYCVNHGNRSFNRADEFVQHILEAHDLFAMDEDDLFLSRDARPEPVLDMACPVCKEGSFDAGYLSYHLGHCVTNELKRLHSSSDASPQQIPAESDPGPLNTARSDDNSDDNKFSVIGSQGMKKSNARTHAAMWQCHLCPERFTRPINLRAHVDSMHLKKRRFACRICRIRFARNDERKKHEALHNAEHYKATCTMCGRRFSRKTNRDRHERSCGKKHAYRTSFTDRPSMVPSTNDHVDGESISKSKPVHGLVQDEMHHQSLNNCIPSSGNATESQEAAHIMQAISAAGENLYSLDENEFHEMI